MSLIKKIYKTLITQFRDRGLVSTVVMNMSHLLGVIRGTFYKLIYYKNIQSSLFSMQTNSTIEIFNKNAKINIGKFVFIRKNVSIRLDFRGELNIGEKVFINDNCNINCVNKISIGKNTKIAPNVCINDHDHNYKSMTDDHLIIGEVTIGNNVWIGSNVVILRDTQIGDNAVIAAGSVVKGNVPKNTLFLNKRTNEYISYPELIREEKVRKKTILISVYDMEIGGIERSLINMLESFDYDTYHVDLLICSHTGDFMGLIPKQVHVLPEIEQYTIFRKPIVQCVREGHYAASMIRIISKNLANLASIQSRFRRLTEGPGYIQMQLASKYTTLLLPSLKTEYDLAISYAWPHDILANKVKATKKIAWIHTDYSKLEIDNKLDLGVWNKFDHIASISDACTQSFLTQYPSLEHRMIQIENITSPEFIRKMADEEATLGEFKLTAFNVVSVGRLSYVKGFDMAVQALRALHDKGLTDIKWYVVGYGGYEAQLKAFIAKYNLEHSFVLLGKKTNPYPYIKACDLYVQPSRYEGKAVTVTEAQILGKPIIITNYPTAGSQVKEGIDGLICNLSVEGIADGIEKLYANPAVRIELSSNCSKTDYSNAYELKKLYTLLSL